MLREGFCTACIRTVYRGTGDEDCCPVCSAPLTLEITPVDLAGIPSPARGGIIPENEQMRLAAVARYEILDTPRDGAFDRITRLAARIFAVPIATITIVDTDRIWFKAKHGVEAEEIGRDPGLCASAILEDDPWVVNDAAADPRALANPLVRGQLGLRFYAGAQLKTADGYNLGTINIIDREPRELEAAQLATLQELAELVVDQMELRLATVRLRREAAARGLVLET